MVSTKYEIRLAGTVPPDDLRDMGAVVVESASLSTVICAVPDQAALYGLLDRLRALGIAVTEVRLMPEQIMDPEGTIDPPEGTGDPEVDDGDAPGTGTDDEPAG